MLVPSPTEVEAVMRTIPKGTLMTTSALRNLMAGKFHANASCPIATGIFARIVAEATEEDAAAGKAKIVPYWRVVKDDGSLNPKFPGGAERQAERLAQEGHDIIPAKGAKPPRVAGVTSSPNSGKQKHHGPHP